ncbi:MAG: BamA/TamA family outer membrane protein [Acidobacteria bacterium]|nr:BamA/TamA family outer membrane protein [Acidobacteriota bacterium]
MNRGSAWLLPVVLLAVPVTSRAATLAELVGQPVAEVGVWRDGLATQERAILELIETRPGEPLSLRRVRESVVHLFTLGDYADVQVSATSETRGVVLRYDLIPLRTSGAVEVRGNLGLPSEDLIGPITRRFGRAVRADQISAVVAMLEDIYRDAGRFAPTISADTVNGRLVFDIDQGPAALIGHIDLRGAPEEGRPGVLQRLGLEDGAVYDAAQLEARLDAYEADVRQRRYYVARFRHDVSPSPDGRVVDVVLDVQTGSPVAVRFEGDHVPEARLDELVPIAREGSIDEDLLEDSSLRLETHLQGLGYRDARVTHERLEASGELSIVFTVDRGRIHRVAAVRFTGHDAVSEAEVAELFGVQSGLPVVMSDIERGAAAVRTFYARQGYSNTQVIPVLDELPPADADRPAADAQVVCAVQVIEGPRTTVADVAFRGNDAVAADQLAALLETMPGVPYYGPRLESDRQRVRAHYLNEGYEAVRVDVRATFGEGDATVDLTFEVVEGIQVIVDHVLVVGTDQIRPSTVRAEVTLRPGEPLGVDDQIETRRRLNALGLFRRVDILTLSHGGGDRRDVVLVVEEAPATSVGYGGGVEVTQRLRASDAGAAAESLELAPRGFFEIGRRNLWGKNRSLDLFTRVSVRRKDDRDAPTPMSSLGLNEYRLLLNYREPRAFGRAGDLLISGFIEQTIRPSFDLFGRGVNVEVRRAIGYAMTGSVGYRYGQNRLTNAQFLAAELPLVDRLFPTVTLSTLFSGLVRDTRDDPLEPTSGTFLGVESEAAFRAIGSEVGFVKTSFQGAVFKQLPHDLVFAAGGRLGLAHGFRRTVTIRSPPVLVTLEDGVLVFKETGEVTPVTISALPASERFFAGGDTTVRGFALDRLGTGPLVDQPGEAPTIDPNGFPTGGNAMLVVNTELRVPVTGAIQMVGFFDAGNVFDRVGHLRFAEIRGSAGFGVRYRSPVGPIRVDLGFKLDRREFAGEREPLTALHFSIGQAF